jgi:hypothetical protein
LLLKVEVVEFDPARAAYRQLIIAQVYNLFRKTDQSGCVTGDKQFSISDANLERATTTRHNNAFGVVLTHHRHTKGTANLL